MRQFKIAAGFLTLVLAGLCWPSLMASSDEKTAQEITDKAEVAQGQGRRVALLVVNQSYNMVLGALPKAAADIQKLADALEKTGFAKNDITIVNDASRKGLRKAVRAHVEKLKGAGKDAVGFFYYIGYSATNIATKTNVVLPVDIEQLNEDIWDDGVETSTILQKLQTGAPNASHLVIFNASEKPLKLDGVKNAASGMVKQAALDKMLVVYATANVSETALSKGTFISYANRLAVDIVKPNIVAVDIFKALGATNRSVGQKSWMSAKNMPDIYFAGKSKQDDEDALAGKRFALLIGNKSYSAQVGALSNTLNDVRLIAASLKKVGFDVTIVEDAGKDALVQAVKDFALKVKAAGSNAVSLFYYAGHGASNPKNRLNYLLPVDVTDTNTNQVWKQSVRLGKVINLLKEQAGNASHFVVFDACRNELKTGKAMVQSVPSTAEKGRGAQKLGTAKRKTAQLKGGGFQPMTSNENMLIAFATAPGLTASDGSGQNGPYAKALAAELLSPGISAIEVFTNVQLRVKKETGQDPWLTYPAIARIFFNGDTSPAELEKLRQESLRLAVLSQQQTKEGDAVAGMLLALEALPDKDSKDKTKRNRPWVAKSEKALYKGYFSQQEVLVFQLDKDEKSISLFSSALAISPDGKLIATIAKDHNGGLWDHSIYIRNVQDGKIVAVLKGHQHRIIKVSFSPDGRILASGSVDKSIILWSIENGQLLKELKHQGMIEDLQFTYDGTRLVSSSGDNLASIWDVSSGKRIFKLVGHLGGVHSVSISQDGKWVATGSMDGDARIWDVQKGISVFVLSGHIGPVYDVAFSPNSKKLVTVSRDASTRIWNVLTGKEVAVLKGHTQEIIRVAFSPDGMRFATASRDKTARLWNLKLGTLIAVLRGHKNDIEDIRFSREHNFLATASSDATVRLWDGTTGVFISVLRGHLKAVRQIEFSPDSSYIATISSDNTARIWLTFNDRVKPLRGHTGWVRNIIFSPNQHLVATSSVDNTTRIWNANTGKLKFVLKGHRDWITKTVFSPNGNFLATSSDDLTARIWDVRTGLQVFVCKGDTKKINDISFSSNSTKFALASESGILYVWNTTKCDEKSVFIGHASSINAIEFSPQDNRIATVSGDGTLRIWDLEKKRKSAIYLGHSSSIHSVSYSSDGQKIATGSSDKTIRIWNANSCSHEVILKGDPESVSYVSFIPGKVGLVSLSADYTVRIWDLETHSIKSILKTNSKNTDYGTNGIKSLALNLDGTRVITGSFQNEVQVWDIQTGAELAILKMPGNWVNSVAFSFDGYHIGAVIEGKVGMVWNIFPSLEKLISYSQRKVPRCVLSNKKYDFLRNTKESRNKMYWCMSKK